MRAVALAGRLDTLGGYLTYHNVARRAPEDGPEAKGPVAAGAVVEAVQRRLGHASAARTLDVYAGLFGDDLDIVATNLSPTGRAAGAGWCRTSALERTLLAPRAAAEMAFLQVREARPAGIEPATIGLEG